MYWLLQHKKLVVSLWIKNKIMDISCWIIIHVKGYTLTAMLLNLFNNKEQRMKNNWYAIGLYLPHVTTYTNTNLQ